MASHGVTLKEDLPQALLVLSLGGFLLFCRRLQLEHIFYESWRAQAGVPYAQLSSRELIRRDVFDVLDAHCHPCIMLGRFALLWMGVAVFHESVSVPTV
jgi:hypothetical protein